MSSLNAQLTGASLILYDGVCGLCNRFVQFVLRRDTAAYFRFCALQDPISVDILVRHHFDPLVLNTICLVTGLGTPKERLFTHSDAVLHILRSLGGGWSFIAAVLKPIPRPLRDLGYNLVAKVRYRIFGRLPTCPLPTPAQRERFLRSP
jgi:predicted DCC family thiol-disulfide oxidoreductase YuxK